MSWQGAYDWLYNLANSNFSSALFGAGFGAWAASWIALRTERQKRLRDEIGLSNTAVGLAATIIETALNLRSQLVLPMVEGYRRRFAEFVAVEMAPPAPAGMVKVYTLMADLRVLHLPELPVKELRGLLLSSASTSASARAIVGSLANSAQALATMIQLRNEFILQFATLTNDEKVDTYYGLRNQAGFIDERYPHAMEGMEANSEDVSYFAELLIEVLMAHGDSLADQYGRNPPKRVKIDLSESREAGRLADRSKYPSFERQFRRSGGDMRDSRII